MNEHQDIRQNTDAADDSLKWKPVSTEHVVQDKWIDFRRMAFELPDGTEVGVVTTGYHSITLDKSICFALVDSAYAPLGTPLNIRIRHKVFPGEVVKKRFYQTNYKK